MSKQRCHTCKEQFIHKNLGIGFCSATCYKKTLDTVVEKKKSPWAEFWRIDALKQEGCRITPGEWLMWTEYNQAHNTQLFRNNKA